MKDQKQKEIEVYAEKVIPDRVGAMYWELIEQTDNPKTTRDKTKNQRLNDLLDVFEYIMGNSEYNSLDRWFE